jgi:hypothetical protein
MLISCDATLSSCSLENVLRASQNNLNTSMPWVKTQG